MTSLMNICIITRAEIENFCIHQEIFRTFERLIYVIQKYETVYFDNT